MPAGSSVHVVTVMDTMRMIALPGVMGIDQTGYLEDAAKESLASAATVLTAARPDLIVTTEVLAGRPADALRAAAESMGPDLLVMGSRGHGRVRSALLGSVSLEIVEAAPCPVLVARRIPVERVLFATDGSDAADAAERLLVGSGFGSAGVEVVAVGELAGGPDSEPLAAVGAHAVDLGNAAAARIEATGRSVRMWSTVDDPAGAIVERARLIGTDLLVIGRRGRSHVDRHRLGAVARSVVTNAPCSVLIVPEPSDATPAGSSVA
jgi:nucleotide-binding universal stress UspA family protein